METVMVEESGRGKTGKVFPLLCQYFLKEEIHETALEEESKVEAKRGTEETTLTENVKYVPINKGGNNSPKSHKLVNDGKSLIESGMNISVEDSMFGESEQCTMKAMVLKYRLEMEVEKDADDEERE